ncbi:uncharacterized protein N7483_001635 [Penicillium malachiteum]|uniref:uncharacterized protein n=1 Tax=Penicillium malachiteum TaxID=1324776 RepID=UPI0025480006|nr:uncharacterized protein N7483_001635 [Penicillium malachiteum]KAJ5736510.1 hypothetical protein N7483_001635 [Penicillium malachiteum]
MVSIITNIYEIDAQSHLTDQEICAISFALTFKELNGGWDKNQILPVLAFTYMVPNHGRILQATYDGTKVSIQHSEIWDFEAQSPATRELFLRYYLSEIVETRVPNR